MAAGLVFTDDSHHTNAKYLLWRFTAIGDWRHEMRFVGVDVSFRQSFTGQPRTRLLRWFPDLRPGNSRPDPCPNIPEYESWREMLRKGEWISTSPFLVTYDQRGAVEHIGKADGC
jgi:hypothetical protein